MNLIHFKIAIRNLKNKKAQSLINIVGLGIGIGCVILLISLFIHETSFNKFVPKYESVYRVIQGKNSQTQYPLGEIVINDIPDVADFFRFRSFNQAEIKNDENEIIQELNFAFADPSIFKIWGVGLKTGSPAKNEREVAISSEIAKKYFHSPNPVGSVLMVKLNNDFIPLSVSGVYRNFPNNSTLYPEFIAHIDLSAEMFKANQRMFGQYGNNSESYLNWDNSAMTTYLALHSNTASKTVSEKIQKYRELSNKTSIREEEYSLQAVKDIYFESENISDISATRTGNKNELLYYGIISILILLISIVNYILLTKADTINRFKELGTKKAIGATRTNLLRQILLESNFTVSISIIPAIAVIVLGFRFVNITLGRTLGIHVFSDIRIWMLMFVVLFLTGTITGAYIGSNMLKHSVLKLLTGNRNKKTKKWNYSFLLLHFSLFIILISGVITVEKQINYSTTNMKGINPDNIVIFELNHPKLKKSFRVICNELNNTPGVIQTAGSSFIPPFNNFLPIRLKEESGEEARFDGLIMGKGMTEMLGIKIIDGEHFGEFTNGPTQIIINKSSSVKYNLKAGDFFNGFKVRGIVDDFHAHSFHSLIEPMVIIQQHPEKMRLLAVKTDGFNDDKVIQTTKSIFNRIAPNEVFEYYHLSEDIQNFYSGEQNQANLILGFSILAIVLSAMGLFGVVLINIAQSTKEIGIRKVSGAKISEILILLNKGFMIWVVIAIIIAIPVAWYLMNSWLQNFAYRTELSWWIFAISGILSIGIALLTVSWHCYQAASKNPVEALRYE